MTSQPAARPSAPSPLSLIQDFVNTNNIEEREEALATPEALSRWLLEHDLVQSGVRASEEDLSRAVALREALRQLLAANHGGAPAEETAATLNDAGRRASLQPAFDRFAELTVAPAAAGVDGALGRLLGVVVEAKRNGSWSRLKVCRNDGCRWAFYDRSRNRSGTWCSMAICGSRLKMRAYRRRLQNA